MFGAAGRMGQEVCRAVAGDPSLELAAAVDVREPPALDGVRTGTSPDVMAGVNVAVDFTVAGAAVENARWCAAHGVHSVIGTSGIGGAGGRFPARSVHLQQLLDRAEPGHPCKSIADHPGVTVGLDAFLGL